MYMLNPNQINPEEFQQQLEKLLAEAPDVPCSCGNVYFDSVINLRKISAISSPTGKEELLQLKTLLCRKCGNRFEKPKIIT